MSERATHKSAEALGVEAHEAVRAAQKAAFEEDTNLADVAQFAAHRAIDLYAAARAVEVAEGMHVAMCCCHEFHEYEDGDCYLDCPGDTPQEKHPWVDSRCTEARARYREEMERVSK